MRLRRECRKLGSPKECRWWRSFPFLRPSSSARWADEGEDLVSLALFSVGEEGRRGTHSNGPRNIGESAVGAGALALARLRVEEGGRAVGA